VPEPLSNMLPNHNCTTILEKQVTTEVAPKSSDWDEVEEPDDGWHRRMRREGRWHSLVGNRRSSRQR